MHHSGMTFTFSRKIPEPYVDTKILTRSGNCNHTKSVTGMPAIRSIGIIAHDCPRSIITRVVEKLTIIVAVDMKSMERPMINLVGKDTRKSSSA